jgi:hypothetical protein
MTSKKRRFRKAARECPVHNAIYSHAVDLLSERGYFSKEEAMVTPDGNFSYIEDAVNLAARFFDANQRTPENLANMPVKFLAVGGGKRTAGYGLFGCGGGHLAIRLLQHKNKVAKGVVTSLNDDYVEAEEMSHNNPEWEAKKVAGGAIGKAAARLEKRIDSNEVTTSEVEDRQREGAYVRKIEREAAEAEREKRKRKLERQQQPQLN